MIFMVFLRLGLTSFGGPVAHLAYFRDAFVVRRGWLGERAYAELVALCMVLPGPASSQVGIGIGLMRGGLAGGVAAWLGFTLPSALAMIACALLLGRIDPAQAEIWTHGLKVVTVAIVAQALLGMARPLLPDPRVGAIVLAGAALAILVPGPWGQLTVIAAGAAAGSLWLRVREGAEEPLPQDALTTAVPRRVALGTLAAFFVLLAALPSLAGRIGGHALELFAGFYRSGALVFGGGHVILPLLHELVVPAGWVREGDFLAGYGAAQAVPGPLFTFAAYLGAIDSQPPAGWIGGAIALAGIFLPSLLLVVGTLPWWRGLQARPHLRRGLLGVNAAVVGLLLAAFVHPVCSAGLRSAQDAALAVACFALLCLVRCPPLLVVALGAGASALGWR